MIVFLEHKTLPEPSVQRPVWFCRISSGPSRSGTRPAEMACKTSPRVASDSSAGFRKISSEPRWLDGVGDKGLRVLLAALTAAAIVGLLLCTGDETMKFRVPCYLACVLAAAGVSAVPVPVEDAGGGIFGPAPRYQLTLESAPEPAREPARVAPVDEGLVAATRTFEAASSNEWTLAQQPLVEAEIPRTKSVDGVEAFSVEDVTAVEYRTGAGIGLGVATSGGWTISQNFVLGRDIDISVFLIDGADAREKTPEIRSQDLGRTIGLRLNWSF